jgi:hypothetical protein
MTHRRGDHAEVAALEEVVMTTIPPLRTILDRLQDQRKRHGHLRRAHGQAQEQEQVERSKSHGDRDSGLALRPVLLLDISQAEAAGHNRLHRLLGRALAVDGLAVEELVEAALVMRRRHLREHRAIPARDTKALALEEQPDGDALMGWGTTAQL